MSYLNIAELAGSPAFRSRVQAAIAVKASYVLGEDTANMSAGQATKRATLAEHALTDPSTKVNAFIWHVVTNGTIAGDGMDAPDSDIEYVVGFMWDRVAGVTAAELPD